MLSEVDLRSRGVGMYFESDHGRVDVLNDINLEVQRGRFLAIVGPSGCGKTTLLRILAGLTLPTTGTVELDPIRSKQGVAFVPQSALLLPWRTLLQNAALGLELKGELNRNRASRIRTMIESLGLAGFENSLPGELSGGMRQRVSIIRALESEPSILFCDEPFSAIDFVGRLRLNTELKYLCGVSKITAIIVTHNIEEAIFLGDEVVVLSGRPGRVIARHTPKLSIGAEDAVECRRSPEFSDLFHRIWDELRDDAT
jgi:ABC-type nitrate/sulfonate/bicarbonate transport system ATPase subunit